MRCNATHSFLCRGQSAFWQVFQSVSKNPKKIETAYRITIINRLTFGASFQTGVVSLSKALRAMEIQPLIRKRGSMRFHRQNDLTYKAAINWWFTFEKRQTNPDCKALWSTSLSQTSATFGFPDIQGWTCKCSPSVLHAGGPPRRAPLRTLDWLEEYLRLHTIV